MSFDCSIETPYKHDDTKDVQDDAPMGLYDVEQVYRRGSDDQQHSDGETPEPTTFRPSSFREGRYATPIDVRSNDISTLRGLTSFQLNHNEIMMQVTGPIFDKAQKVIMYVIKGSDKEGTFEVIRTQEQFSEIRSLLVSRWPGCYIPAVPPKRLLPNTQPSFLEQRRKQLEMFCQNMSETPYLHYSPEYQVFLKSSSHDISFELMRFQKIDYVDVLTRLEKQFGYALEHEATNTVFKKIEEFKGFLQNINGSFKRYKKVLKKVVKARLAYFEQFALLQETMCSDFERKVLTEYQGSNNSLSTINSDTYLSDMKDKADKIKKMGQVEPMEYLHAWIKLEGREIEAFLEAIAQREKYIAKKEKILAKQRAAVKTLDKVLEGKSTIKMFFFKRGKEEEVNSLETQIANYKKEAEILDVLIEKIALVLANCEIEKFKRSKADQYNQVITMAAQNELLKLRDMSDFWIIVLKKKDVKSFGNIDIA